MDNEIVLNLDIDAPVEEVYKALTDDDQLTSWYAEYADVSTDDYRYNFWGRMTPEAPEKSMGSHKLLAVSPNQSIKFEWVMKGLDTTVFIDLKQTGQGTQLRLSHIDLPTKRSAQYAVEDFWKLSLENLRHWIEQKAIGNRVDYTLSPRGSVQVDVDIEASRARVFEVLTNTDEMKRYIAEDATVELEVSGRFDYGWENGGPVKLLDLKQDESLTYQWQNPETVVTWTLEGSGNRTRLTLVHSGFAIDKEIDGYHVGWSKYLNRIKFVAEGRSDFERIKGTTTN